MTNGTDNGEREWDDYGLETDEWRVLALAPLWALELAGGEGRIGAGDVRALARVVQESFLYGNPFVRTTLAPLTEAPEKLLEDYRARAGGAHAGLQTTAGLLRQVAAEQSDAYRKILMAAVWRVVAAGGGPEDGLAALARYLGADA